MDIAGEVIQKARNDAGVPAHMKDAPLSAANIDLRTLKSFARKHGRTLEWVLQRFFEIDPDIFGDIDKSIVLQREQAKYALDVMKSVMPKDVKHDVNVQVTSIERRIIDPAK